MRGGSRAQALRAPVPGAASLRSVSGMKIAVSGKGGVGKTTVSAGIILGIAESGRPVFAVDADPDANLGFALGFPEETLAHLRPVVEMDDLIREKMGDGAFFRINPRVDDILDAFSLESGNIRLLRMGGVKQAGTACYCRENAFLERLMGALLIERDEVVVLDMSAGIEHLTRGTARGVDVILVVVEPSQASLRTARITETLARDLGVADVRFIANKVRNDEERAALEAHFGAGELLGFVPFSDELWGASMFTSDGRGTSGTIGTIARSLLADVCTRLVGKEVVGPHEGDIREAREVRGLPAV
ncbi:MAG: AAA family ATPase [Bacillota bacterium]|nr:AAA family ATPase [Bacillota bacterium]